MQIHCSKLSIMKFILLVFFLALPSFCSALEAQGFDFFYLVLEWPGSFCGATQSCCYPNSGKPASDFLIHGLWPNNKDGSYPSNCDPNTPFDSSQISDLSSSMATEWPSLACPSNNGESFWAHEWAKHGTCAESVLNEHDYFHAALSLKDKANGILQMLSSSGIEPNDNSYSVNSIIEAINGGIGYAAGIECNQDESGSSQLYQVYLCADTSASSFINCPVFPKGGCSGEIKFPSF
ncbi:ribonuclease 1-like [Phalaenopsis equestris]|uniref:ribonuclease 1-like n=1 Tax=Phalaenopsis equestris TaxID=78828 RepID=UPI0009E2DBD4|nr:ribonuclease 1-like [Phalaenopsis equestris]